ncbi:MAG: hypothetical protein MMC33_006285 [Icmadophila ericetorum]|nr:hypothetical protein [Icmadophila ericetorum]
MLQRIKGAIDSRIAEEQARQRAAQTPPSRSNSTAKRPAPRAASPSTTSSSRARSGEKKDEGAPQKGPDPAEFEPEFVVGDEDTPTRSGTPLPGPVKGDVSTNQAAGEKLDTAGEGQSSQEPAESGASSSAPELPMDVRVKLRKLDKLESRYRDLLRSYRIAHARVSVIESFETSLRENTPLTSINDPGALVEYLNQLKLKGDMVLDELKRVSSERDTFKQKLAEAEKSAKEAWDNVTELRKQKESDSATDQANNAAKATSSLGSPAEVVSSDFKSPTPSIKLRTSSIPSISLFSPKAKPASEPKAEVKAEEFFSFDRELPRLEAELKEKQEEVMSLTQDLAVARESTQSMVKTLEDITKELNVFKERSEKYESDLADAKASSQNQAKSLKSDLDAANTKLSEAEMKHQAQTAQISKLEKRFEDAHSELNTLQKAKAENEEAVTSAEKLRAEIVALQSKMSKAESERDVTQKRVETLNDLVGTLREQARTAAQDIESVKAELNESLLIIQKLKDQPVSAQQARASATSDVAETDASSSRNLEPLPAETKAAGGETASSAKKKNKKKKKGAKTATEQESAAPAEPSQIDSHQESLSLRPNMETVQESEIASKLEAQLDELRNLLAEKDEAIEKLHGKLRGEEELREEIDSLRDDLITVGQEHVTAKDKIKDLLTERGSLETRVASLEKEIENLNQTHNSNLTSEEAHNLLFGQFEELKIKATSLQTDLTVAQQLASTRFKDLTDLKIVLQKAQPELISLRKEVFELKAVKEELTAKITELQRNEARHEAVRAELNELKRAAADKDAEMKLLNQKISSGLTSIQKGEETRSKLVQDLQQAEVQKRQISLSLEDISKELAKSREELSNSKTRVLELDETLSKLTRDNDSLKEEIELKTVQYVSAESLMSSMRDQSTEMAIQAKETRERCESLEEEVGDAHRLLAERSREGETMRRLLTEVEGRTDSRIREMKERMDAAIEERDRAEDEASIVGRRRTRELEEIRNKLRDIERVLKRTEEDKEELEAAQRDWKRRREELEQRTGQSTKEAEEVRMAMNELRDALDASEKQARDLDREKTELRRALEDAQQKLDKLQKTNKVLAEEARTIQASKSKVVESQSATPRSSLDSGPLFAKAGSPGPKPKNSSITPNDGPKTPNGQSVGSIDYIYLKNILLQFLEQKDKKHQMQLIPVLGMLLHFDRKDEQKWMAAITTK